MWGLDNQGSSPDGCDETYRGTGPFSEPETAAIEAFIEDHDFPVAFNYHSYSDLLIYPFGYEYENNAPQEDIDIFIVDGKFNTRNYKAVDWLCTKIENGQTSLILDIQEFEEE